METRDLGKNNTCIAEDPRRIVKFNSLRDDAGEEALFEMSRKFGKVVFAVIDFRGVGTVSFEQHNAARECIAVLDRPGFAVAWPEVEVELDLYAFESGSEERADENKKAGTIQPGKEEAGGSRGITAPLDDCGARRDALVVPVQISAVQKRQTRSAPITAEKARQTFETNDRRHVRPRKAVKIRPLYNISMPKVVGTVSKYGLVDRIHGNGKVGFTVEFARAEDAAYYVNSTSYAEWADEEEEEESDAIVQNQQLPEINRTLRNTVESSIPVLTDCSNTERPTKPVLTDSSNTERTVRIRQIAEGTTFTEVKKLVDVFGRVKDLRPGNSQTTWFVEFVEADDASRCVDGLKNSDWAQARK